MKIVTILLYLLAMFPQLDSCDARECHGDLFEGVSSIVSDCCSHGDESTQHHCSVDSHHHGDESCSFRSFSLIRTSRDEIRRAPLVVKPVLAFVLLSREPLRAPPLSLIAQKFTHTPIQLQQVRTTIIRC